MQLGPRVQTHIDFMKDGKQLGALDVPHSRNDSAWGAVMVPIGCIKNGEGPTVLLTAGNHGDEYEGQVALTRLLRRLDADDVSGRIIVIPALNLPAARAGTRVSPIDGGNMNRIFPGRRDGNVTQMIAHYVETVLLPMVDVALDIHSGGTSLEFVPSVVMHHLADRAQAKSTYEALKAFGAPVGLVLEELDSAGMLDVSVEEKGKIFLSTEVGGAARVGVGALEVAERGVDNILKHFRVIPGEPDVRGDTRLLDVKDRSHYVRAPASGLYAPRVSLGDWVSEGDVVGEIVDVRDPTGPSRELVAEASGLVWGVRALARTEVGDTVTVLASELDPTRLGV
jgi:N-alpha-acetyl-L-2,4-diaminobutyrate deacetylase